MNLHRTETKLYDIFCSYSDIMVHRLLAVATGALDSYPDLLNKAKTQVGAALTQQVSHALSSLVVFFSGFSVRTSKVRVEYGVYSPIDLT